MRLHVRTTARFALLFVPLSALLASSIPVYTGSVICFDSRVVNGVAVPSSVSGPSSCVNGDGGASVDVLPLVGIGAFAGPTASLESVQDFASLTYSFEVSGGNPGDSVPVVVWTSLNTTSSGSGFGHATETTSTSVQTRVLDVCTLGCEDSQFYGSYAVTAVVGEVESIDLILSAEAGSNGVAEAVADPWIYVDPGATGGPYTVELSDGVGNGTVPEPSAWFLFMGAALAMGAQRALRRRTPTHPAVVR